MFANHYIAVHLQKIGGGKTYSEPSEEAMAAPNDTALASKANTVFRGETLRSILLNACAFDTMATVTRLAAVGALVAGVVLVVFSLLGIWSCEQSRNKTNHPKATLIILRFARGAVAFQVPLFK